MPSLQEVRVAKDAFRQQFPDLMVGICKSESDAGWELAVRIPEGTTQEEHGIPNEMEGVPIQVKEVSYKIRPQEDEDGTSNHSPDGT